MLQQHIARKQMRHAYLFTGPSGVGRRTLALRFAQALNCSQPPEPGIPCRSCRPCTQIERMQQADLTIVEAESVGGTLKVGQIRELRHTLSLSPYESPYRVALLLRFQEANASAQNALLKTLEEAPEKVILILTADTAENLFPTIVSRCEVLRLRPMPVERLEQELKTQWDLPAKEARLLAHLSGGRVGEALRLHDAPDALQRHHELIEELLHLLHQSIRARFAYVESKTKGKDKPKGFKQDQELIRRELREVMHVWLSFWRDVILVAAGSKVPLVNLNWETEISQLADQLGLKAACVLTADLKKSITRLDAYINIQLLVEVLLLDWPRLNRVTEVK